MSTQKQLLAKAQQPSIDALRLHPFYRGKMQVMPKCPIAGLDDFAVWYTPGVAAPCKAIQAEPQLRARESVRVLMNEELIPRVPPIS